MNQEKILTELTQIVINECDVPEELVQTQASIYDDLEMDSVTIMNLTCKIEDRFEIDLQDSYDELPDTLEELATWILKVKEIAC